MALLFCELVLGLLCGGFGPPLILENRWHRRLSQAETVGLYLIHQTNEFSAESVGHAIGQPFFHFVGGMKVDHHGRDVVVPKGHGKDNIEFFGRLKVLEMPFDRILGHLCGRREGDNVIGGGRGWDVDLDDRLANGATPGFSTGHDIRDIRTDTAAKTGLQGIIMPDRQE